MGSTFIWQGTERQQHDESMRACRARREKYGQDHCEEKDGSCTECLFDMQWALRVKEQSNG